MGAVGLPALHSAVPNGAGRLGSLLETFLPWPGTAVPPLGCLAVLKRSVTGPLACVPARARLRQSGSPSRLGVGRGARGSSWGQSP